MRPRKQIPSRRCGPCGKWFEPDPRAAKTQVACCRKCRAKLRNQQAKNRRDANPEAYRAAERVRQAHCREKKRAAVDGTDPPAPASPRSAVEERLKGILEQVLTSPPPSRAVLGEALRELVRVAILEAGA
jgi:hypothetical protein